MWPGARVFRPKGPRAKPWPWLLLAAMAGGMGAFPVQSADLPPGLVVTGLREGTWNLYRATGDGSELQRIPTVSEPRTPALAPDGARIAYIGSGGELREIDVESGEDRIRASADSEGTMTQPAYGPRGGLVVVRLEEGASRRTDLVVLGEEQGMRVMLAQRSAQFEPDFGQDGALYYGNVLCAEPCGRVIQEIWRFRAATGRAAQLTRLNTVSRQPHVGPKDRVYFSSNAAGHYHIWRLSPGEEPPTRITGGQVVDAWPAAARNGDLYFLRRTVEGVSLMLLEGGAKSPRKIELGRSFKNLKDLRIRRCATDC